MKPFFVIAILCLFFQCTHSQQSKEVHEKVAVEAKNDTFNFLPNDERIRYVGRIDFTNDLNPRYSWPGIQLKIRFKGKGLQLQFNDEALFTAPHTNFYEVVGLEKPFSFKVTSKDTLITVADNLEYKEYELILMKRTEAMVGKSGFLGGKVLEGELLPWVREPDHKIEFIGNSITCGYGNDTIIEEYPKGNPTTGFHSRNENHYMSYASIVAREFNADHHATAYSGKGVWRNYGGGKTETIPDMFSRVFPHSGKPKWDFDGFIPDLVVINLGTNDFANAPTMPIDLEAFLSTYLSFVKRIRSVYPKAAIICLSGGMMNDTYPPGQAHLTKLEQVLDEVVDQRKKEGDVNIYHCSLLSHIGPYGEDWHPSMKTHQSMAEQLSTFIRERLKW